MGMESLALRELRALRDAIGGGRLTAPITESGLLSAGYERLLSQISPLTKLDSEGCLDVLDALIGAKQSTGEAVELVWTGPEHSGTETRDTYVVVRQLLAEAEKSVLIAGYAFDHCKELFEPLREAMEERGVQASFFVDVKRAKRSVKDIDTYIASELTAWMASNWPGAPRPALYFDPRTANPRGVFCSLHAKCVVVDEKTVLIGSANFTNRGHTRNVEAGVLLRDEVFATTLTGHLRGLTIHGGFERCVL